MKAILILAGPYSSSFETEVIWKDTCLKNNIEFEMYDLSNHIGKELALKLDIKSFPVLIVNDNIVAVGHPDEQTAEKVIQSLVK